jgi:hypothetical protein
MTPTERAAFEAAIAALERARDWIDAHHFDEEASTPEIEEIYQRQVKETVAQINIALASLRAVAPAPADQSDAGRDGAIERSVKAMEIAAKIIDYFYNDRTGFAGPGSPIQCIGELSYCVRALASAPSETVGRGEGARRIVVGEDVVDKAMLRGRLIAVVGNRATVLWNGEDRARRCLTDILSPADPRALPTADRDAIREALNLAKESIEDLGRDSTSTYRRRVVGESKAAIAKLTAALGMLGPERK